jgi:hypothetical protein
VRFRDSMVVGWVFAASLCLALPADSASLEKAKVLRTNGLAAEAKRELVELTFDSNISRAEKAEALLVLGDIAIDEGKPEVAKENWSKVVSEFAGEPVATMASEKLTLLGKLSGTPKSEMHTPAITYMPGTVLVVGPEKYPWSIAQISGALGSYALPFEGTLREWARRMPVAGWQEGLGREGDVQPWWRRGEDRQALCRWTFGEGQEAALPLVKMARGGLLIPELIRRIYGVERRT